MVTLLYVQHLKKDLYGDTAKGGILKEVKGLYYSREEDIEDYSKGRDREGRSRSLKKLPRKLTVSSLAIPLHKIQNIKLALW